MGVGPLQLYTQPENDRKKENDCFLVISNAPETCLEFDSNKSCMLAFGIDKQLHPNFQNRSLGPTVKLDALETSMTFVKKLNLFRFKVYCSSENPDQCTHAGMQEAIKRTSKQVGDGGIFILFFGGHGINDSNQKWALASADFDLTKSTYLTTENLIKCISQSECKARYILVILDCCYSGVMATTMTAISDMLLPHTYVLAAGTAYESSFAVGTLRHSIFTYFLNAFVNAIPIQPNSLPLAKIYDECKLCCEALSSLILSVDTTNGDLKVNSKTAVPSLSHFDPSFSLEIEETDSSPQIDVVHVPRLLFVNKLFQEQSDKTKPRPQLHTLTHAWLRSLIYGQYQPINILEEKQMLVSDPDGSVLKTVVTLIMQSIAVIELVHNRNTLGEPDIFLLAFINTIAVIDMVHPSFPTGPKHMFESWQLYHNILLKYGIDDTLMKKLHDRMVESTQLQVLC